MHGEFGKLLPKYDINSAFYSMNKDYCDELISKKVKGMDHIYSDSIMSWSWLDKYGMMSKQDYIIKELLFKSISGRIEILGLSPNNDEHLFLMINQNPNINSVVYYYFDDLEKEEIYRHINKSITLRNVRKFWASLQ